MTTLVIEKSTNITSFAWIDEKTITSSVILDQDEKSSSWVTQLSKFTGNKKPDSILVGLGPGSFAGVRTALAYALGCSVATKCNVVGLPSPCALATQSPRVIIGDARRELFWVALFDGLRLATEIFQVTKEDLINRVPRGVEIFSPDDNRIGATLKELFEKEYKGGLSPNATGLATFAISNPAAIVKNPLPLYLNPAVR